MRAHVPMQVGETTLEETHSCARYRLGARAAAKFRRGLLGRGVCLRPKGPQAQRKARFLSRAFLPEHEAYGLKGRMCLFE